MLIGVVGKNPAGTSASGGAMVISGITVTVAGMTTVVAGIVVTFPGKVTVTAGKTLVAAGKVTVFAGTGSVDDLAQAPNTITKMSNDDKAASD